MISDAMVERLLKKAQARVSEQQVRKTQLPPLVWIPDGIIQTRFYLDREGEFVRTVWRHKINEPRISVKCAGESCPVCKHLESRADGWDTAWRFASREISLAYAYVFSFLGEETDRVETGEPVILMFNYKLATELSGLIQSLDHEEIKKFFSPDTPFVLCQIKSANRGRDFSLGFLTKRQVMEPLPEDYPPLSEILFREDELPRRDHVTKFIEAIERSYAKRADKEIAQAPSSPVPPEPDAVVEPSCFGSRPDTYNPKCLLCSFEEKCSASSAR